MDLNFKQDTDVIDAQGHKIGQIDRIVIDSKTKQVTDIVIRKGLLFREERLAAIQLVAQATEKAVQLRSDVGNLYELPKFEERKYQPAHSAVQARVVAVREGAKVKAKDGENVGRVEEIVTDSGSRQAIYILVAKGRLNKKRKLVPTFWVRKYEENQITLAAPANTLDKLQPL